MTYSHVADGSARGQENGVHAVILEQLRPLGCNFLHQARNIRKAVIGVVAPGQAAYGSLLGKLAKACQWENDIDVLLRSSNVVGDMSNAQAFFWCIRRDDTQGR